MERLAEEVSKAEGLKKALAWQTVQQWENGTSAPKRKRLAVVQQVLGVNLGAVASQPESEQATRCNESSATYALNQDAIAGLFSNVYQSLVDLGSVMEKQDVATREATALLIAHLCRRPEDANTLAKRIVALLSVEGNIGAQRSINSQTSKVA